MATRYWVATSDGPLSTAGNWSPSGAPAAGDVLILSSGAISVTGGNYTSLGAIAEIRITPDWTGNFGTSDAYVQVESNQVVINNAGKVYIDTETDAAGSRLLVVGCSDEVHIAGKVSEVRISNGNGAITIEQETDTTTSSGNTDIAALYVLGTSTSDISIDASVSSLATLTIDSATVDLNCNCTTARVYGGKLNIKSAAALTTAEVFGNGKIKDTGTGTITTLTIFGGIAEFDENASDGVTVTNCTINDGILDLSTALQNITFTNAIVVNGGDILPPIGSSLTVAY